MKYKAFLSIFLWIFLAGCGPSPAEIKAEKNLREAAATARLNAFREQVKDDEKRQKDAEKQQEVDKILAPYIQQERIERANAAFKEEYIRRGNEIADRQGR
uniref:hypothetical protein n=1 Tax=Polaromonas sp. TaxID=1869339 RepID=UPI0015EE494D|nr:hypothetical protein [Polaromonas sp.]